MKVVVVTSGSRGDVQPYVLLGMELAARGHEVVLATEARMERLVEQLGAGRLTFHRIAGDPTGMLFSKESQALLAAGRILPVMRAVEVHNKAHYADALDDTAAACAGASLIVAAPLTLTATMCVAEKLRVPWVPVVLGPVMPTGEFPSWALANSPFRFKWLNRASYNFLFWALWQQEKGRINAWRVSSLGLPPRSQGPAAIIGTSGVIMMASTHLIPGLAAPPDWPASHHITGFAFPPPTPDETVAPALREFVAAGGGDAPVYLGFGSMPAPDPKALLLMAIEVVKLAGKRAVLVAGWSELGGLVGDGPDQVALPEQLLVLPEAPHDWLLPRCAAAVHHCGVGTCGAVLRAGIPSVPCPVMLDQPWMAARLGEAGVACKPLPFQQLNAKVLADAIREVCRSADMQARAAAVAAEVASYGGVAQAADLVLARTPAWPDVASA